jgi:hypothetical protein
MSSINIFITVNLSSQLINQVSPLIRIFSGDTTFLFQAFLKNYLLLFVSLLASVLYNKTSSPSVIRFLHIVDKLKKAAWPQISNVFQNTELSPNTIHC